MSQDSTPSIYRHFVWATVGAAAAYSIYAICSAYVSRPNTTLRRSNAIHRSRRHATGQQHGIDQVESTPDAPLGMIILRKGEEAYVINLATTRFPTNDQLQDIFTSHLNEDIGREVGNVAMDLVLSAALAATRDVDIASQIDMLGFGELVRAMTSRDENDIRVQAHDIPAILHVESVNYDQIERALHQFFVSEKWLDGVETATGNSAGEVAETDALDLITARREPSQGIRGLLYYIAEEDAKRKAYEHRGISCEECGELPIRGIRWHCLQCPDFDLCSTCEMHTVHPKTHVFAKIKIPVPILSQPTKEHRIWYPGDPRKVHPPLDANLRKRLCSEHGFAEPQIDAFYDQFTCIANVPYPRDCAISSGVKAAIDRRAFNKALTCEKWNGRLAPNAMYDRMFAYYDVDKKGLVSFEDFVAGLAYLRGPKRFATLHRAIKGYDMNGDGYVDREDFLRLLRAKFEINEHIAKDAIEGHETEQTQAGMDTLRSSQPISSIFAQEDIPPGVVRPRRGKQTDSNGDMQPLHGTKTILDDDDPWQRTLLRNIADRRHDHERLRYHFSRFEEMIPRISLSDPISAMDGADRSQPENIASHRSVPVIDLSRTDDNRDNGVMAHVPNALWIVTQRALNELLDRLFSIREEQDREVTETEVQRRKWRKQIDEEHTKVREMLQDLKAMNAKDDPLVATALSSHEANGARSNGFTGKIVPTDWDSLARREQEIPDKALEDLLTETGYSVRSSHDREGMASSAAHPSRPGLYSRAGSERSLRPSPLRNEITQIEPGDPTLPHNRPNESADPEPEAQTLPSQRQLSYWMQMDHRERSMQERGGPGRLSYDEIETITVEDKGGELRGLIKSWLEWASF